MTTQPDTQTQAPTTGIYPLAQLEEFAVADGFPDPRGWTVYGSDRQPVGTVEDLLVDLSTLAVRYVAVWIGVPGSARGGHVLVPVGLVATDGPQRVVVLDVSAARAVALPAYAPRGARPGPLARADEQAILRGLAAVGGVGGADAPSDDLYYNRIEFSTERFYRGFAGAQPGLTGAAAAGAAADVLSNAGSIPPATLDAATANPPGRAAAADMSPAPPADPNEVRVVAMGEEAVVTTRRVVKEVLVIKRRRVVEQQEVEVDLRSERVEVVPPTRASA